MLKLKIGQKSLLLFLIISLLPLAVINVFWLLSEQNTLRSAAEQQQSSLTKNAAEQVEQFIASKVSSTILHSQSNSVQQFDTTGVEQELFAFINQDTDLQRVALIDVNGQEKFAVDRSGKVSAMQNVANSDAFRAATFLAGKEYISNVRFDSNQQPIVTIAVPLVTFATRQSLADLSTAERGVIRNSNDIKGVLIADVSLENLWAGVLSARLGQDGYAYVVDAQGRLIAHPDEAFIKSQPDLTQNAQVAKFITQPGSAANPAVSTSEKGIQVLGTHQLVALTGWAVIAQQPIENIFAPANRVARLALFIFLVAGVISTVLSILFSRNLTKPIKRLLTGARQLTSGNLDTQIPVNSTDEIGVLGTQFNLMTDNLKQVIHNLKAEGTKLNIILNNVDEGFVALDSQGRIVLANMPINTLTGKAVQSLKGSLFTDTFNFTKNNQPLDLNVRANTTYKDVALIDPSKRLHYFDVYINEVANDPNGITSIITLRDQTEERDLEMMKLDFVSMAAHELRTPITAVRGYLKLLSTNDESMLSNDARRFVERAQASTNQLVSLVSNLLNVSKIERGALTMVYSKLDWAKVVQDTVADHQFSANEQFVELTYDGPTQEIPLYGDEMSLKEVLNNFIANAIHYTANDGHVTVRIELKNDRIITFVQDNGVGIPPHALSRLFTKFYRVKGGIASGSGGTGLGLYISKSIVELHKGSVSVESEQNRGSTFSFSLPAYDTLRDEEKFKQEDKGVNKNRGWITKNIAR